MKGVEGIPLHPLPRGGAAVQEVRIVFILLCPDYPSQEMLVYQSPRAASHVRAGVFALQFNSFCVVISTVLERRSILM